jgi:Domain of unknown function (DUF1929)/Kelch motif
LGNGIREVGRRDFLIGAAGSALGSGTPWAAVAIDATLTPAALAAPSEIGAWSPLQPGAAVAIHIALLPGGNVLAWQDAGTDPSHQSGKTLAYRIPTQPGQLPQSADWAPVTNDRVDLFCAGQTMLPDGRVLVVGGQSGGYYFGIDTATIFDPFTGVWVDPPGNRMANPRWYPSLITLPNGEVLALSGTQNGSGDANLIPEVWKTGVGGWRELTAASSRTYTYPWLSIDPPSGRVFVAGPQGTKYLSTVGSGKISAAAKRNFALRSAGTFAVYGRGKVLAVGGGDSNTYRTAEYIDLLAATPTWTQTQSMLYGRRYATATTLPDGKVLVTGGGEDQIGPAGVLPAELWDPATGRWSTMASMAVPRLYHSIALLLPDGRVMVGGGGRRGAAINHADLQFFVPPYLYKGARPIIVSVPTQINYGRSFVVQTAEASTITKVNLIRLGALTHAVNSSQVFYPAAFTRGIGTLTVVAPPNGNYAPPGYYMLFILNEAGVPSVGKIIQMI